MKEVCKMLKDAVIGVCLLFPMDRQRAFEEARRMCAGLFHRELDYDTFLISWKESKNLRNT